MHKTPYFLRYPCFIIENTDGRSIRCLDVDGQSCIALFNDENLVQRYLSQGAKSGVIRAITNKGDLRAYLKRLSADYTRFVSIDANATSKGYVGADIHELLEELGD